MTLRLRGIVYTRRVQRSNALTSDEAYARVQAVYDLASRGTPAERATLTWPDLFGVAVLRLAHERAVEATVDRAPTHAEGNSIVLGALRDFVNAIPHRADEVGLFPRVHVSSGRKSIDAWVAFAWQTVCKRFRAWLADFLGRADLPTKTAYRPLRDRSLRALWILHVWEAGKVPRKEENAALAKAIQSARAKAAKAGRVLLIGDQASRVTDADLKQARYFLMGVLAEGAQPTWLYRGKDGRLHLSWREIRDVLKREASITATDLTLPDDIGETLEEVREAAINPREVLEATRALLSAQELEVLDLWRAGKTPEEIGKALGIARGTVYVVQRKIRLKAKEKMTEAI